MRDREKSYQMRDALQRLRAKYLMGKDSKKLVGRTLVAAMP